MDKSDTNDLQHLAQTIRDALHTGQKLGATVWHHYFAAGEALIAAEEQVSKGQWKKWLRASCLLSGRTAFRYMQVTRHRELIEAALAEGKEMSLNAALRLISKQNGTGKPQSKPRKNRSFDTPPSFDKTLTKILHTALSHLAQSQDIQALNALSGIARVHSDFHSLAICVVGADKKQERRAA